MRPLPANLCTLLHLFWRLFHQTGQQEFNSTDNRRRSHDKRYSAVTACGQPTQRWPPSARGMRDMHACGSSDTITSSTDALLWSNVSYRTVRCVPCETARDKSKREQEAGAHLVQLRAHGAQPLAGRHLTHAGSTGTHAQEWAARTDSSGGVRQNIWAALLQPSPSHSRISSS